MIGDGELVGRDYAFKYCPNCGANMRPRENLKAGAEYADAGIMAPAT